MKSLFLALLLGMASAVAASAEVRVERESAAAVRERVVQMVNAARAQGRHCGEEYFPATAALQASAQLRTAAQRHAEDMARSGNFAHRGADGSQPRDRVLRTGYQFRLTGENIAFGPESAEEVVAGWLASPGHCANIMDARFGETGIGVATGRQRGHIYWAQVLALPARGDTRR